MSVSTILHANFPCIEFLLDAPLSKKWHSAFAKIYCSRALLSLRKTTTKNTIKKVPRSSSYTVLSIVDVPVDNNDQYFKVDPRSLTELVKEKNLDRLHEFRGFHGVASALKTAIDGGICSSDEEDFAGRRETFGSNTHKKPP